MELSKAVGTSYSAMSKVVDTNPRTHLCIFEYAYVTKFYPGECAS